MVNEYLISLSCKSLVTTNMNVYKLSFPNRSIWWLLGCYTTILNISFEYNQPHQREIKKQSTVYVKVSRKIYVLIGLCARVQCPCAVSVYSTRTPLKPLYHYQHGGQISSGIISKCYYFAWITIYWFDCLGYIFILDIKYVPPNDFIET